MITCFSNSFEFLFEKLKERLFTKGRPFEKRVVVVPSPAMKGWLMARLANEAGIAAGIEVVELDSLLQTSPPSLELALRIEAEIRKKPEGEVWEPLYSYLGGSDQRIIALSKELAFLFGLYSRYGEETTDWQKELWNRVNTFRRKWEYSFDQIHLFALSYVSPCQHQFLLDSPKPVYYYLLSPCQHFWSDLTTQRENIYLQKKLSKKNWESLESYLRENHTLLANFGKLGREMALLLEQSEAEREERYFIPAHALQIPAYSALMNGEEGLMPASSISLLQGLQTDLLLMRNPDEKIEIEDERSLQIHDAPSLLREVQILHNNLLDLRVEPGEIVVMAPDIMEYYPYIRMVFDDSPLKYQINDLSAAFQSPLVRSFMFLLTLSMGRWDAYSLWQLFEEERFRKKHHFSLEDLSTLKRWAEEARILWGENGKHRKEILGRHFEANEGEEIGTWEWAFGRLIEGLAMTESEEFNPLPIVDTTEMELLGKWISLMRSLKEDLRFSAMSMGKWADYLQNLLEKYFSLDALSDADEALLSQLERFRKIDVEGDFPFATLYHHLEKNLTRNGAPYREKELNVVRFSSLLPMRAVPSNVTALMGMQEGKFPKIEGSRALNKLPRKGYIPSINDFDRYLFLETIVSTKKCLLISYQGVNSQDGERQGPSILVSELMDYCRRAFTAQCEPLRHPYSPFDSRYFSQGNWVNYSEEHYKLAKLKLSKKEPPFHFIPTFSCKNAPQGDGEVTLKQLAQFAKNPMRPYFQHTLGIYLKNGETKLHSEEPFDLNNLEKHHLKSDAMTDSLERTFRKAEKAGRLPHGIFKTWAYQTLSGEVKQLQTHYKSLGIDELFTIDLSQMPPLTITTPTGARVTVTGLLENVCAAGLVMNLKDDRTDAMKAYPLMLVAAVLREKYTLPFQPNLLLIKDGGVKPFIPDAEKALAVYLDYFLLAQRNLSPLLPELASEIARKELLKGLTQKLDRSYNQELVWSLQGNDLAGDEEAIRLWQEKAVNIYGGLF